jgi:hypothetical protein
MTAKLDPPRCSWRASLSWVWLGLALVWVVLVRWPLVLNTRAHLDSDLAVDGLTLLDALNGQWRWHYPGTPFIGTPPVLLSWVQAKVWGATPTTLVTGGVVAWCLVVGLTFLLNRRAFGASVASWGLVPLAFASTGAVWLSGRVTGGHLLAVAWHAGAFVLLWDTLTRGGWKRSMALGLWSGFGLYLDSMFVVTWTGLVVATILSWWGNRVGMARVFVCLLAFGVGAGLGLSPRFIGQRVDPHDSYVGQFSLIFRKESLEKNAKILALDCLPRLVAGHRLPSLQAEPEPNSLSGTSKFLSEKDKGFSWLSLVVAVVAIGFFCRGMVALLIGQAGNRAAIDPINRSASRGVRWGLIVSSLAVVSGFLVIPNITNSDNYRYLVFLLVPGSTGVGLWLAGMASRGRSRLATAWVLSLGFAFLMTSDSARWYARFGWLDSSGQPIRKEVNDQALDWLDQHPEVSAILGDYWDVYRLAFLTGGRVLPVPFPQYPDRFPENKHQTPAGRVRVVIVRPGDFGPLYRDKALAQGATELHRGDGLSIVSWPEGMRP